MPTIDEWCPTGVEGLDHILGGGLPCGCVYLVQGDPGSGKTTLALQFLFEGLRRGESALYVTLSETRAELDRVARSHGWTLDDIALLELAAIEALLTPDAQTTVFHPSEMELNSVAQLVLDEARRIRPARVVFDSLSEFRLMADTQLRYRRQLLHLKQAFSALGSTVLLLDDKMDGARWGADPHILSLTHGVIEMEQLAPDYGRARRRVRVQKMRGVAFREGYHDYSIETGGLRTYPRLAATSHPVPFTREGVSSGLPELDALLGGGLDRGTTTLILGQAGTGKSTIALQFLTRLAARGEAGHLFAFDETRSIVLARADALGMQLSRHVDAGTIHLQQVDPAELSPGEFARRIVGAVEAGCKVVVIDSLNGYLNAMPGETYLSNQLHELSTYLNQQGVVTIFILAQHGLVAAAEAPVDLSYLADTVVSTRFFEASGRVRKALSVIKRRSGPHETTIRELALVGDEGLRIGAPLTEFQGVLTGMPAFRGDVTQMLD
ncbi:circadian clock protein KaiC [Luteitalea sp. TBR-22]|uniref:ATPase domain-containing protein n=1 Tax=Luteitalea sp. TBR-22 TaxID=2802971 RepID=UPI001AF404E7|nr:ATPase domain-containing protein [Luteitalea sp. TBR-22]BCS31724.1 circadian clock protein KaiC [Luteitalea sp. TBR-22]